MRKSNELEDRLIVFVVSVIKLVNQLPKNFTGKHLMGQLVRSGTAPAAHYAEARGAESHRDFIHKLKLSSKELNETQIWLKIIVRSGLLSGEEVTFVLDEAIQLSRIFNASIKTARSKNNRNLANSK